MMLQMCVANVLQTAMMMLQMFSTFRSLVRLLNPKPFTLNPQPYTLNFPHQTLDPKPYHIPP